MIHQVDADPKDGDARKLRSCHLVIDVEGEIQATSAWKQGKSTPHIFRRSSAPGAIAVCMQQTGPPTESQVEGLAGALRGLHEALKIGPESIFTHREVDGRTTSCPGTGFDKLAVLEKAGLVAADSAFRVRISKATGVLEVSSSDAPVLRFEVAAGPRKGGVQALPDGEMSVCRKDSGTAFGYYLGLCNERTDGGEMGIHGGGGRLHFDWTIACVALTDRDMEVLYRAVGVGTPVEIRK